MHIQLLVLGAIATIVFLILRVKKGGLPAAVAKTCASIFFVFTGLASAFDTLPAFGSLSVGFTTFNPWSFYIIGGLVCAVLGDLWLDLKYTYLENSNEFTALGMSFFLGTQVLYFVGAFNCFKWNDNASYIYASIVVGAIFALICVFGERRFLKVKFGKFKAISAVYSGVLGLCAWLRHGFHHLLRYQRWRESGRKAHGRGRSAVVDFRSDSDENLFR